VTATAAGSARWNPQLTTSLELVYTSVGISGNNEALAFEGSAVLDSLRLVLLAQWNLSRVVALQLAGRVLLYREAPTFAVSYEIDPRTSVEAELRANFVPPIGAWNLVPTLALSGKYLNFKVGAGYGHRWLPVVGLVFSPGLVLDLDFFVRF